MYFVTTEFHLHEKERKQMTSDQLYELRFGRLEGYHIWDVVLVAVWDVDKSTDFDELLVTISSGIT